jgi:hypothetical protein
MQDIKLLEIESNEPQEQYKKIIKKAKYITYAQFMDIETKQLFSKKVTLAYLELPVFKLKEEQLQTDLEKWTYVLKNLPKLTVLPKILNNKIFRRVFTMAEYANLSKEERQEYNNSIKNYRDMNNSISQRDEAINYLKQREVGYQQEIIGFRQREAGYQQREAGYQQKIAELERQLSKK